MSKIETYAKALWLLKKNRLLATCKEPVKAFIRKASEDSAYHASTHFRSRQVAKELKNFVFLSASAYHKHCSMMFCHEHIVPVEAIYQMLANDAKSESDVRDILLRYSLRATITKEENQRLSRSTMPSGFYNARHRLFQDPLARYKEAGIAENLVKRKDGQPWWNKTRRTSR